MARGSDQKLEVIASLITLTTQPDMVARHLTQIRDATVAMQKVKDDAAELVVRADAAKDILQKLTNEEARVGKASAKLANDLKTYHEKMRKMKEGAQELDEREAQLDEREKAIAAMFERTANDLDAREQALQNGKS